MKTKIRSIQKFLDKGIRVKISMKFKGRELSKSDRGKIKFNTIISNISGKIMQKPTLRGNIMQMWAAPL